MIYVVQLFKFSILYEIIQLDDDAPEFSSSMCFEQEDTFFFLPVALKNLVAVHEVDSLSPIMQLQMMKPSLGNEFLLVACGRGQSSSLRILQREPEVRTIFFTIQLYFYHSFSV